MPRAGTSRGACVIRIAATILVAVQALLPPGMCWCQFIPCVSVASPSTQEPAPAPSPSATAHADESCCSCPACRTAVPVAPAPSDEQSDRQAPDEHSLPTPTSPCSGCPVVSAGPLARVVILHAPEQIPLETVFQFVVTTIEATSPRPCRPTFLATLAAPPLFVRHCALLI